ncbi:MAG TPA: TfoX/Sxy family protein, partial [Devosiaceae bacterium]|nr:TfoX/Sxy family protein [Devosiaceae bacterium]
RIRNLICDDPNIDEKRMFGGIAFMLNGNMLVGPMKDGALLARVGKDAYDAALARPGAGKMMFTGREMPGFVEVRGEGIETDDALAGWVAIATDFVGTLPVKPASK